MIKMNSEFLNKYGTDNGFGILLFASADVLRKNGYDYKTIKEKYPAYDDIHACRQFFSQDIGDKMAKEIVHQKPKEVAIFIDYWGRKIDNIPEWIKENVLMNGDGIMFELKKHDALKKKSQTVKGRKICIKNHKKIDFISTLEDGIRRMI